MWAVKYYIKMYLDVYICRCPQDIIAKIEMKSVTYTPLGMMTGRPKGRREKMFVFLQSLLDFVPIKIYIVLAFPYIYNLFW